MPITTANLDGVVLNEIGTSPTTGQLDLNGDGTTDQNDEFIELFNTSGSDVDISGWQIWYLQGGTLLNTTGGNIHTFLPGTTLGAGQKIVVADIEGTPGTLALGNAVYMNPTVNDPVKGTPTWMSLSDNNIVILYDPVANEYVQFNGEDANSSDQQEVDDRFGPAGLNATRIGPIETGLEDNTGNSAQRAPDGDTNWVDDVQTPGATNMCFLAGTDISTPTGAHKVETLTIGDIILTADGTPTPVKWIGRQNVKRHPDTAPVRISAGALRGGLPHSDLTLTGDHGMVIGDMVIIASALVNGETINWVPMAELEPEFTVYHIETENHDVILANGAPAETFVDYVSRKGFDNYDEYLELYGAERIMWEMPMPRILTARMVPQSLREKLNPTNPGLSQQIAEA